MKANAHAWPNIQSIEPKEYICGYCGKSVGSSLGYRNGTPHEGHIYFIYICPNCGLPSLVHGPNQSPGPMLGRDVADLPPEVASVYKEIRDSIKNSSFTGAILLGRKLLMHLAVDKAGAKEGASFAAYVEHLKQSGYIPPNGDKVLTFIKDLGNEKNHELKIGTKPEAEKMLKFIEALLIFIYEFSAEVAEG